MELDANAAQWIGMAAAGRRESAPLLRRQFTVRGEIVSAELAICGLGYYEAWINGARVGDHVLDPAQTDYTERVMVVRHDVTEMMAAGENVLGVMLGDGWYNQNKVWAEACVWYGEPRLWCVLTMGYDDGREERVCSDGAWRCSAGPVVSNNIYAGEIYDARREQPGWNTAGFCDDKWERVVEMEAPGGRMELQTIPPVRVTQTLTPVSIRGVGEGSYIVDMGQNYAGWVHIRVQGNAGTGITLRFAERLDDAGMLDTSTTGVFATGVEQTDRYICRGGGVEEWEPRFTYHGFRYVEVSGWPGALTAEAISGRVVHTDFRPAGGFECSDERLNVLHRMALWTHRSNVHGVPEDCPARERCGWLGDANVVCEYSLWNYDSRALWEKYLDDIETTRRLHGGLPCNIAPGRRTCGMARADWAMACVMIPWYVYVHSGARRVLDKHWEGMTRLMEHLRDKAGEWIVEDGYGDWCDPGGDGLCTHTPPALTSSLWFYQSARVMSKVGQVLGETAAAQKYERWAGQVKAAVIRRFYDAGRATFGSQTGNALALTFGVAPAEDEARVAASLVEDIRARDTHVTTGIMGLRYLFEVLSEHGHGDLALALMHQDSYPSFGDMLARGATTLWEGWGEPEHDRAYGARSLNHPMMGGYDNWFYTTLAGMQPDEAQPGFAHIYLRPRPPRGLAWVRAWHDTPHGRLASAWRHEGGEFVWEVTVPAGCRATATLPFSGRQCEWEGGTYQLREKYVQGGVDEHDRTRHRAGTALCHHAGDGDCVCLHAAAGAVGRGIRAGVGFGAFDGYFAVYACGGGAVYAGAGQFSRAAALAASRVEWRGVDDDLCYVVGGGDAGKP